MKQGRGGAAGLLLHPTCMSHACLTTAAGCEAGRWAGRGVERQKSSDPAMKPYAHECNEIRGWGRRGGKKRQQQPCKIGSSRILWGTEGEQLDLLDT